MNETHWFQDAMTSAWKRRGPGPWSTHEIIELPEDIRFNPCLTTRMKQDGSGEYETPHVAQWEFWDDCGDPDYPIAVIEVEDASVCPVVPRAVLDLVDES